MRRFLTRIGAPVAAAGALALVFATAPGSSADDAEQAQAETYADYSMLFERSAGQYWSGDQVAGQWAWNPQSDSESHISWGDPAAWPPTYGEEFVHDGDWVVLEGWHDNGTFYRLDLTTERIGDGNCENMEDLPVDGPGQHYVQWEIPTEAYCLEAVGVIVEESSGIEIDFSHTQIWSPPAPCANEYYTDQTCIKQWESWSDNNGSPGEPVELRLERDQYIAKGIGMAFMIDQTFPTSWRADLRSNWNW
jgi:hypothetical protein